MEQSEIIRMAREAGFISIADWSKVDKEFERFYQMAFAAGAAHEREKRTKELMQLFLDPENQPTQFGTATLECREEEIAAAYARGHDEGGKDFEAIVLPAAIAAEREACAKVCDAVLGENNVSAAIRARG